MQFRYHTSPGRPGYLIAAPLVALALVVPSPLLRLVILALASGPLAWALVQWRRRGHTIRLYDDYLLVQRSLSGRVLRIPYRQIRGQAATRRGGLALVYQEMPRARPAREGGALALTDARPALDPDAPPCQRLVLTAKVEECGRLVGEIAARRARAAAEPPIPAAYVGALARRRQVRDLILVILAVLGTPLYVAVILRVLWSF